MVKLLKLYSVNCRVKKKNPRATVQANLVWASPLCRQIIDIWAHVIVAPLAKRTVVFNKGTSKGLIESIPAGGQKAISTAADKDE